MTTITAGRWIRRARHKGGANNSQAHRVDLHADDVAVGPVYIVKCGRRLTEKIPSRPASFIEEVPEGELTAKQKCWICGDGPE